MLLAPRWYLIFSLIKLGLADYFMQESIKADSIKNNYIPTALVNIDSKSRQSNGVCSPRQCSRPLRSFITGNLTYLANYMALEKSRENTLKDVWLLFVTNDFDQELITSQIEFSIRREVYIAKRTARGYEFSEVYKTITNTDFARLIHYGNWDIHEGLTATQSSVVERRGDFGGAVLRTPKFEWERDDSNDEKKKAKLLKVVWNLLEQRLNFTTKAVFIPNNSSKYQLYNSAINISVQMLVRNEADVSMIRHWPMLSDTTLIENSRPLSHVQVYMKEIESIDSWLHFSQPFAIEVWYLIILMIVILLVIILLMHYLSRETGLVRTRHNCIDVYFTLHQVLCQQGGELRQELNSISLLFVFINLWIFLIRGMYSAALTSTLAIDHYNVPFNSLEGLLANGQYEFGVHRNSWTFSYYYIYGNSFVKKLNKFAMEKNISNLPVTYLEGLRRVCSDKKYAFLANSELVFELRSKIPCRLYHLTEKVNEVNLDYAMSKHNEYLPFINRWLDVFMQVGLTDRLKRKFLRIVPHTRADQKPFKSLKLEDTALLLLILIGGVVLSIAILIAEIIYDKMRRNQRYLNVC